MMSAAIDQLVSHVSPYSLFQQIRRAAGRNEPDEALRKNAICPKYTLHGLVRERYPRFVDALSDLDDALTLTFLFAALPTTTSIKSKVVGTAKQLAAAWGAYCSTAACVTKSFISVKGVYLEATVQGIPIRWIVPHSFTQFMPEDVDYRVMTTFFEFYETLLHFVLFKLYNDIGVRYPLPALDASGEVKGSTSYILGSNLRNLANAMSTSNNAVTNIVSEAMEDNKERQVETVKKSKAEKSIEKERLQSLGAALNHLDEENEEDDDDDEAEDDVDVAAPLKEALENMADVEARASIPGGKLAMDDEALKRKRLFAGLTFFLSREVPRGYLEVVCLAFGGKIGWEGPNSPIAEDDPSITHHIVDRPQLLSSYSSLPKSREYVQPQWILDCTNFMFLLPIAKYAVGVSLPPHLSPWVDNEEEGYKPAYAEEIERLKAGETVAAVDEDMEAEHSEEEENAEADDSEEAAEPDEQESEEEDDEEEEEEEEPDKQALKEKRKRAEKRRRKEEEEAHTLAKSMMNRKAAHLYGRMQHGIAEKKAKVEALEHRRREIEHSKRNGPGGKTPLKQKVERLKKERKAIEKEYSNTGGSMKKSKKSAGGKS